MALRRTKKGLADYLNLTKGTVQDALDRRENTAFRLVHLDLIAEYLEIPAAELIAPNESKLSELRRDEQRLIRQWRAWPTDVRARILSVFEFFGELWPEDVDQRNWLHDLKRLNAEKRADLRRALDALLAAPGNRSRGPGESPASTGTNDEGGRGVPKRR